MGDERLEVADEAIDEADEVVLHETNNNINPNNNVPTNSFIMSSKVII